MGISGHMLGPRKLRRLSELTGLPLDRAYIRNHDSEGRVIVDGRCVHYEINPETGEHHQIDPEVYGHWSSCPREGR